MERPWSNPSRSSSPSIMKQKAETGLELLMLPSSLIAIVTSRRWLLTASHLQTSIIQQKS